MLWVGDGSPARCLSGLAAPAERSSARFSDLDRLSAVLISPTWENAWAKLPSMRPAIGSYCSAKQPDVIAQTEQSLEQLLGLPAAPLQNEVVGQPKAAGQALAA